MTALKTAYSVSKSIVKLLSVAIGFASASLETLEDSIVDMAFQLGLMCDTIIQNVKLDLVLNGF